MNYILRYIGKSKYLGFIKVYYKEFSSYQQLFEFVEKYELRSSDYDIYGRLYYNIVGDKK